MSIFVAEMSGSESTSVITISANRPSSRRIRHSSSSSTPASLSARKLPFHRVISQSLARTSPLSLRRMSPFTFVWFIARFYHFAFNTVKFFKSGGQNEKDV